MPILPTAVSSSDLHAYAVWADGGPRPPVNPLARLIQSSYANQDYTDPASVRAAQAGEIARALIRKRKQISSSPVLHAAYRAAGWPNIVQMLTRQIHRLQRVR